MPVTSEATVEEILRGLAPSPTERARAARRRLLEAHLDVSDLRVDWWMTAGFSLVGGAVCLGSTGYAAAWTAGLVHGVAWTRPSELAAGALVALALVAPAVARRMGTCSALLDAGRRRTAELERMTALAERDALAALKTRLRTDCKEDPVPCAP
jgi:hypothetical protein